MIIDYIDRQTNKRCKLKQLYDRVKKRSKESEFWVLFLYTYLVNRSFPVDAAAAGLVKRSSWLSLCDTVASSLRWLLPAQVLALLSRSLAKRTTLGQIVVLFELSCPLFCGILVGVSTLHDLFKESCSDILALAELHHLSRPSLLVLVAELGVRHHEHVLVVDVLEAGDLVRQGLVNLDWHPILLEDIHRHWFMAHVSQQVLIILGPVLLGLLEQKS